MKTKRIKKFERDMHLLVEKGHFINVKSLSNNSGIELFISLKVDYHTANCVSNYIKTHYKMQSTFYVKSHSIKVLYDNSKN